MFDLTTALDQAGRWLNATSPPLVAGCFLVAGAVIALVGVLFNATLTNHTSNKTQARSLFVGTVTAERAQWRQDLRQAVGDLVRLTHLVVAKVGSADDEARLQGVRAVIRLRLNPNPGMGHEHDQAVLTALADLALAIKAGDGLRAVDCLDAIEAGAQQLLKQEWEKSKVEARTGRLFASRFVDWLRRVLIRLLNAPAWARAKIDIWRGRVAGEEGV